MIYENREVIIHEPVTQTGKCLILLHGGTGSAANLKTTLNLPVDILDTYTVVYPNANSQTQVWRCGGKFGSSAKDSLYIFGLINHLIDNYGIDINQIVIGGMSSGGMMAYRIAAIYPDIIQGVLTFSSSYIAPEAFNYTGKILQIQGFEDANIPFEGSEDYPSLRQLSTLFVNNSGGIDMIFGAGHQLDSLKQNPDFYDKIRGFLS